MQIVGWRVGRDPDAIAAIAGFAIGVAGTVGDPGTAAFTHQRVERN